MLNDKVIRTAFIFSFIGHCLFLGMPAINISPSQFNKPQDITIRVEIEKPALLPKIDVLGEKKKVKKSEEIKEEHKLSNPEIPSQEKAIKNREPEIKEKIEVLKPDNEAMFRYQDTVKQKIESCRRYPPWAKKQGFEGISFLAFTLLSNGMVCDIKPIKSSGFNILDKEAISTIKRASPFKPIPEKFNCSSLAMEVAIVFQIK
ncbi:MAG: TonB family protein [Candidatus Omnitrophota bacterium]|nr:MAG: TonB family protein [Candidatus Omnitrophota bacterium]